MPWLVELHVDDHDEQLADHEDGGRDAGQHADGGEPVEQAAGPGRGQDAGADPGDEPQQRAADDDRQGRGQRLLEDRGHRFLGVVGVAEVAVQQVDQVVPVLNQLRLVQPQVLLDLRDDLRGRGPPGQVAGDHFLRDRDEEQEERQRRDRPEDQDARQDAAEQEACHPHRSALPVGHRPVHRGVALLADLDGVVQVQAVIALLLVSSSPACGPRSCCRRRCARCGGPWRRGCRRRGG